MENYVYYMIYETITHPDHYISFEMYIQNYSDLSNKYILF